MNAVRRRSLAAVIFGAPRAAAAPVANSSSVSEVDVSLSTVMALNEPCTDFDSMACSAGAAIGASVKTKESMVAMSGAIMPAPLAMPEMRTRTPPISASAVATLGNVSVVMMARAASSQFSPEASFTSVSSTPSNLVASSGSPMTPVEAMKISLSFAPVALDAILAASFTASAPILPVKALALPELTSSARAFPDFSLARHQSTGADGHFDLVKTPATCAPLSSSASMTSVRPL